MKFIKIASTFVFSILLAACNSRSDSYKQTLADGMKNIEQARQMEGWYGPDRVDHMITHFGFEPGKPVTWTTISYMYGRYELWMTVQVEIDYKKNLIEKILGEPQFLIKEVNSISDLPTGQISVEHREPSERLRIDKALWEKIIESKGDLGFIPGINKNDPVEKFDEWRKARGHVINAR